MKTVLSIASGLFLSLVLASTSNAAIYTIDSAQSSNIFGLDFDGTLLTETSAGSSVTSLSGTIDAIVPVGGGMIVFGESGGVGTSNIVFNAGTAASYLPSPGGALGAGFDEVFADGTFDGAGNGDGVFTAGTTNASLTVSSLAFVSISNHVMTFEGSATTGATNSGITTSIVNGYASVDGAAVGVTNAELWVSATNSANEQNGNVGYSLNGDIETITIPYSIEVSGANNSTLFYTGTVVASRMVTAIPEPSGLMLLSAIAATGCTFVRRRRTA